MTDPDLNTLLVFLLLGTATVCGIAIALALWGQPAGRRRG